MQRPTYGSVLLLLVLAVHTSSAQSASWLERYQSRVAKTQSEQPRWVTPVVTVTPRLEQEWRTDFSRQRNPSGYDTWSLGTGRGPETIPFGPVQITFGLPPYLLHSAPGTREGFGDVSFLMKYRLFARNEQHGNAIVSLFLGATIPTGKNNNGLCCATVTPTLALGKGWGRWDVVSTTGGLLPITNAAGIGHAVQQNATIQYRFADTGFAHFLWPEVESNTTVFVGGPNDGKVQSFVTPGLVLGRLPLHLHTGGGREASFVIGFAEQIAVTRFHPSNHNPVITVRVPF